MLEGNPFTGEVTIVLNGERQILKLTLGSLAELEAAIAEDSLVSLIERFEAGRFTTKDVIRLLLAGLRGGGWQGTGRKLLDADIEGGMPQAIRVAALLLTRSFAMPVT
ncbi:gene transfer agent family protein [uncultured Jannaschia sp.]|uniref:gene transfer agent family protein n=1 Tax=uncultured Jannaschia sp. TaxID=293347 RepID=UPI002614D40D|nr:gene transfer agent family protein [uncultured Jannaschia sp.]